MIHLYRVQLSGSNKHRDRYSYFFPYVIATDMDSAYEHVARWLKEHDYGFDSDAALVSIHLLAEMDTYPLCETILHITQEAIDEIHSSV